MQAAQGTYYIAVIEDCSDDNLVIVGCTTLLVELKFIHSTGHVSTNVLHCLYN